MEPILLVVVVLVVLVAGSVVAGRRARVTRARKAEEELAPVRQLAFEDVTALGEELQSLDLDLAGAPLDEGARADYQRALDAYDAAKKAGDQMTTPEDIGHVTKILDDARYAIACVRARVAGEALTTRRPPCFFDPRHGTAVEDVSWAPPGGTAREVPACALDAERVRLGADPDVRQVVVGSQRVPYWEAGRAYEPYAAGYFGASMMNVVFAGMLLGSLGSMDGGGWGGDGGGDGGWDGGGDLGGGDGGGFDGGGFDLGGM